MGASQANMPLRRVKRIHDTGSPHPKDLTKPW
jgi:hypothetical protein